MYAIKAELEIAGIYLDEEVERFCQVYFQAEATAKRDGSQAMNAALDPAVSRFMALLHLRHEPNDVAMARDMVATSVRLREGTP